MPLTLCSERFTLAKAVSDARIALIRANRVIDGISQRMLTLSLRGLERDGLVTPDRASDHPTAGRLELTEFGVSLRRTVKALGEWAIEHIACIRAAQEKYDSAAAC